MLHVITRSSIGSERNAHKWIGVSPNTTKSDDKYFVTLQPLHIELSDKTIITIPAGFEFDGSSVPRWLEVFFRRYGPFLFAALIHDWMYVTDYRRAELGTKKARKFADREMLVWSDATHYSSNRALLDNWLRYKAVRLFGKKVYKK